MNFIDTALAYGDGRSERLVGQVVTVSTVIPGMRSIRNVERNVAVSDGRGLPDGHREALRAHRWVRNFYR